MLGNVARVMARELRPGAGRGRNRCSVPGRSSASQNLRTQLQKIIRRAGLTPWPKLWQNLRSTRATELANEYPAHTAAWLGHSTLVAQKHYWQVTDEDFERARGAQAGALHLRASTVT
jgi:hypothetical protein